MFKPSKSDESSSQSAGTGASQPGTPAASSSSGPGTASQRPAPASRSVIGGDLKVVGNLISKGELQIEGEVEGDVSAASVTVGRSAKLNGSIKADRVEIQGSIKGQVDAESGAFINGHCRRRG